MLDIKLFKDRAELHFDHIFLNGSYSKNFRCHTENDAICFFNDNYDNNPVEDFFPLISNIKINDIPDKVQLCLEKPLSLTHPFDIIPDPFDQISFVKKNNLFFVRFKALDYFDNTEWRIKWSQPNYFAELINEKNNTFHNIKVFEHKCDTFETDYLVEVKIDLVCTIGEAFDIAVSKLFSLITRIENRLAGYGVIQDIIDVWNNNKDNSKEEFWQNLFEKHSWILSQSFSYPLALFQGKAYLGGKKINKKGDQIIDFAFLNKLTGNIALFEIKTPMTPLVGRSYRGTYSISSELSGSLSQLLKYKDVHLKNFERQFNNEYSSYNPKCILIVGYLSTLDSEKREAFELFRNELKSIEILTFDEVFEKIQTLLFLLKETAVTGKGSWRSRRLESHNETR